MSQSTWWSASGSTTSKRLWLGFGALIVLLVLLSVAIIVRVFEIQGQVDGIAKSRNLDGTARQLQTATLGYTLAVREYVQSGDPRARKDAVNAAIDVEREFGHYARAASTAPQRELAQRFAPSWQRLKAHGGALLVAGKQPLGATDSLRLYALRSAVGRALDDGLQADAILTANARSLSADDVRTIADFALLLLVAGVIVAVVTSALVGRGVVRGERELWASRERLRVTLASLTAARDDFEQQVQHRTAELAGANQFLQALLDNLQEGIVACDAQGVLTLFNRATRQFHGLPQQPLPAERWADHYHLFLADGITPMSQEQVPLFRALRGETVRDAEMVIATRNGEPRVLLANGQAIHDQHGRALGALVSMHDITRRKHAEAALQNANDALESRVEQRTIELSNANAALRSEMGERLRAEAALGENEARLRFVMDSMPQKIFTARPDGSIDYYNPQWIEFTGLSLEQILDWGWKQFIHPDDLDENVRAWQHSIDSGEAFKFEHRFRRADGDYRWHITRALPLRDDAGVVSMWIGSNTDINEQKQSANELQQLANALSEADRHKSEFLAMLAHELRNPLAPISNALQILRLTQDGQGSGETVRTAAAMMDRQVRQMVRLVDDLLDVSRISRGKIGLYREQVELAAIVTQAVEASTPSLEAAAHVLTVSLPPGPLQLSADPVRLAQVLGNLLNNACKYTPDGGRIGVTLRRDGDDAVVTITDNGIGIHAAMLPRIFEMFTQLDQSLERSQGGLGIGLTLVQRLVEMHGGSVSAASAGLGRGSEFVVRLPLLMSHALPAADPVSGAQARPGQHRVLVVDDNRDSASTLALYLQLLGHETRTAHDGIEAVEAAADFAPDLVLLDLGMPRLNGYGAARAIRQQPWGKTMVLVALSGWGQAEDRRKSADAGFDGHLVKPVDHVALAELLSGLPASVS